MRLAAESRLSCVELSRTTTQSVNIPLFGFSAKAEQVEFGVSSMNPRCVSILHVTVHDDDDDDV